MGTYCVKVGLTEWVIRLLTETQDRWRPSPCPKLCCGVRADCSGLHPVRAWNLKRWRLCSTAGLSSWTQLSLPPVWASGPPAMHALLLRSQLNLLHPLLLVLGGTDENGLFHCLALWSLDSNICVKFSHHYLSTSVFLEFRTLSV